MNVSTLAAAALLCCTGAVASGATVSAIKISDPITPVIADFIGRSIDEASASQHECLVIQLDTPGGLENAMRDIVKKIFSSDVPVVVYVSPPGARAASAGAIITLSAHIAAMAPGTNIGAAHPVSIGMGDTSKELAAKAENDSAAYAESIAEKRYRNKEWAVRAVRESISCGETEALSRRVIDVTAPDLNSLLSAIDGRRIETPGGVKTITTRGASVITREMKLRERVLKSLADPTIAYMLLLIGIAGLYFELSTPGALLPGVIGGISLITAFYSLQTLSANYAGLLLIGLGIVLFIAEIKITSYGILSLGGVTALVLGSLMLFDSSLPYLRISLSVIIAATLFIWIFFVIVVGMVVKAQRRRPQTGIEGLIGQTCEAVTDVHETGKVFAHGEYWNARSGSMLRKGDKAIVTAVQGMELIVEKAPGA